MAQALLAGVAGSIGQKLAKSIIPKVVDKLSVGAGRLWEGATGDDRAEFWKGLKEGGSKILHGDFSGALDQAAGFLNRKTPTERQAEYLAQMQKNRPKDAARKHMIAKKPKKRKKTGDEDIDEFEDLGEESYEDDGEEKVEVAELAENERWYKPPPVINAGKAPVRVPKIIGMQPPLPRPVGGVKPVPSDPYAKMEFTRSSLFPQPRTAVERRRPPPVQTQANIPDVVGRLERIYGPMDTTVRELKRMQAKEASRQGGAFKWTTFGQSEFGNTSGGEPPASRAFLPSARQMNQAVTMRDRMNAMMHIPEPGRQAPPSYLSTGLPPLPKPGLPPRGSRQAKQAAAPEPLEAPALKIAVGGKTGKPLKGAAKASFEKAQVKITVPKKKLTKK